MHRRGTGTGGLYDILAVPRYPPGHDFVHEMQRAASHCARIIVVLSPAYARSEFGEAEWRVAFTRDPSGEKGLLIPIRVAAGLLFSRVYVDLAGCGDEETARALLLEGVRSTITRPITATLPGMIIGSRPAADGRERRAKVQCPAGSPTLYHPPVVRVRPLNLPDRAAQRLLRPGRARGRRPTTANWCCPVRLSRTPPAGASLMSFSTDVLDDRTGAVGVPGWQLGRSTARNHRRLRRVAVAGSGCVDRARRSRRHPPQRMALVRDYLRGVGSGTSPRWSSNS